MPLAKKSKHKGILKKIKSCHCDHWSDFGRKILHTLFGILLVYMIFFLGTLINNNIKKNMKNMLMNLLDKEYLKKRHVIETIFSSIKSCGSFEHSRHRNVSNAFCHIFTSLISYQLRPIKSAFFKQNKALA